MDKLRFLVLLISIGPFLWLYSTNPQWNYHPGSLQSELLSLAGVISTFIPGIPLWWIINQEE